MGWKQAKKIKVEENQSHRTEVTLICQSKLSSHHHFWPFTVPSLFAVPEAGIPRLNSTCSLHSDRKFFRLHESGYLIIQSPCSDQANLEQCLIWGSSESFQSCKVHNVCRSLLQSEERFFLKISATYLGVLAWALFPVTRLTSIQKSGTTFSSSAIRGRQRPLGSLIWDLLWAISSAMLGNPTVLYLSSQVPCSSPYISLLPLSKPAPLGQELLPTHSTPSWHTALLPQCLSLYWMPQGRKFSRLPRSLGIAHLHPNILTGPHHILESVR